MSSSHSSKTARFPSSRSATRTTSKWRSCTYKSFRSWNALRRFSDSLARFAAAHGKTGLYNETITWAYLLIIRERLARKGGHQTWTEFAAANEDLLSWKDSVLKKYYREETLTSDLAKKTFVLPDKAIPTSDATPSV